MTCVLNCILNLSSWCFVWSINSLSIFTQNISFVVIGIYLPPGNSVIGYKAELYINYLSSLFVRLAEKQFMSIIGDNNRIDN